MLEWARMPGAVVFLVVGVMPIVIGAVRAYIAHLGVRPGTPLVPPQIAPQSAGRLS